MASIANKKGESAGSKKTIMGLVLGFSLYMYYFSLLGPEEKHIGTIIG
jgi:hypothetical protein